MNFTKNPTSNIDDNPTNINNLLLFTDSYDKINKLSTMLDELFLSNELKVIKSDYILSNDEIPHIIFNYIYEKEFERGNIEYKRTLETYHYNNKTNKLVRQIYWRIYEGIVNIDKECCFYIIGIEDSGNPSFLTQKELFNSLDYIKKCINNIEITYSYLFVKNTVLNFDYIIVKFCPEKSNFFDYF